MSNYGSGEYGLGGYGGNPYTPPPDTGGSTPLLTDWNHDWPFYQEEVSDGEFEQSAFDATLPGLYDSQWTAVISEIQTNDSSVLNTDLQGKQASVTPYVANHLYN